jgi:hypothetical protein
MTRADQLCRHALPTDMAWRDSPSAIARGRWLPHLAAATTTLPTQTDPAG